MIECSICHAMNEDSARFCAECGQRLVPAQQASAQAPVIPQTVPAAQVAVQAAVSTSIPESAPLVPPPIAPSVSASVPHLDPVPETPRQKLHSPLLQGDDFDEPHSGKSRFSNLRHKESKLEFPHRGQVSASEEEEEPYNSAPPQKPSSLRSPLLGMEEPLSPEPHHDPANKQLHLRSPLLGGDFEDEEPYYEEEQIEQNPNALRSPLLQARVPISERKPQEKLDAPSPQAAPPVPPINPNISADKASILRRLQEESKFASAPTSASVPPAPAPTPRSFESGYSGGTEVPSYNRAPESEVPKLTFEPIQPPPSPDDAWRNTFAAQSPPDVQIPAQMPTPEIPPTPVIADPVVSHIPASEPSFAKEPESTFSYPPSPPLPPIAEAIPPAEPVGVFDFNKPAQESEPAAKRPRFASKMFGPDDSTDAPLPASRFSEPPVEGENVGAVKFFVGLLFLAIAFKLWLLFDYIKANYATPAFLADQFGQITAICFLIFIGNMYCRKKD